MQRRYRERARLQGALASAGRNRHGRETSTRRARTATRAPCPVQPKSCESTGNLTPNVLRVGAMRLELICRKRPAAIAAPRPMESGRLAYVAERPFPDGRPYIPICWEQPLTRRKAPGDPKPPPAITASR